MCNIAGRNLSTLNYLQRAKDNNSLDTNEESDLHAATVLRYTSFVLTCNRAGCAFTLVTVFSFRVTNGFNKQPQLDIRTFASHLTKRCSFSCFSLQHQEELYNDQFFFLFNYFFYIHPLGHSRVAFCIGVKMCLSAKPFI